MQTTIQELIKELEGIKETKCKTLQEVVFFDGVLAIIEGKYLEKEKNNLIAFHIEVMKEGLIEEGEDPPNESDYSIIKELAIRYYEQNFGESKSESHE